MNKYRGIGVSKGIAIGKLCVVESNELEIKKTNIKNPDLELERFDQAIENSDKEIQDIIDKTEKEIGTNEADIFKAHQMILKDPELIGAVKSKVKNEKLNVEYSLNEVRNMYINMLQQVDNEYMKERANDIKDVTDRVLNKLMNVQQKNLSCLNEPVILIAHDLTPSDTATMDKKNVLGLVTDIGGSTSHTAIMARTLQIPAVVGLKDISMNIKDSDNIVIDGEKGIVIINPDKEIIQQYEIKQKQLLTEKEQYKKLINELTVTLDGHEVELAANIGTPDDLDNALNNGAEGIGLYRTEFLYMNTDKLPDEQEQFLAYKKVAEGMAGKPVIIRTLDIGGDKELKCMNLPQEMNPFLGYRAIRICLDKVNLFKVQIKALLRASFYGNIKIMLPMISSLDQVLKTKEIIKQAKEELASENKVFAEHISLGVMIEVPAAVMISDELAKEVDFFSIGTNDLIQYTMAVDRTNEKISYLYNPLHPGLLRMIKLVIENAHKYGKKVGMCGEMAGDIKYTKLLIGLGLDEFSMSSSSILPIRQLIKNINYQEEMQRANKALQLANSEEIIQLYNK